MENKRVAKYNAAEVRITRGVAGLFLYALMALSLWGVRRLYRTADFLIYITAGAFLLLTVLAVILMKRQKKAGVELAHKVWGMDYWLYLSASAAAAHLLLALSRPVEFWAYTAPMAYVLLAVLYILYLTAMDQGGDFVFFGFLTAGAGMGAMAMYQTYYNPKQLTISTRILSYQDACTTGWVVIGAALLLLLYFSYKKTRLCWKQMGSVAIFALYWMALQLKWGEGEILTWIAAGVLAFWYVILRILRQIKVVS